METKSYDNEFFIYGQIQKFWAAPCIVTINTSNMLWINMTWKPFSILSADYSLYTSKNDKSDDIYLLFTCQFIIKFPLDNLMKEK